MWYRLARIVGPNVFWLHDDLYDDSGFPDQPHAEIDRATYNKYRYKRGGPYTNVESFLDDLLTRFILFDEEIVLPDTIDLRDIERALFREIEKTTVDEFRYKSYQIMRCLPSTEGIRTFLKNRWATDLNEHWGAIARCVIKDFSHDESSALLTKSLVEEDWRYPHDKLHVLSDYQCGLGIDILEEVIKKRDIPLLYGLGAIIRSCNPTWKRLKSMILAGRPMSLLALDALWIEDSPQYSRYFNGRELSRITFKKSDLKETLARCLESDSAPRVKDAVENTMKKYDMENA